MIPRALFAALLLLLALLQAAILPAVGAPVIKPHLVLVALLLWSMGREPREGLLWAFGAGMLLGLLTLSRLGVDALALLPVVVVGWFSRSPYFRSGLFFPMVMALVATLAHDLTLALVASLTGDYVSLLGVARLGVLGALLNMLAVPPLYAIVYLLDGWIGRIEAHAHA